MPEAINPAFPPDTRLLISSGLPFHQACRHHADHTFGASRIYIIVSKSISETATFTTLRDELGPRIAGVRFGIAQHVPWTDVLEIAKELQDTDADLIVTLGAGSLTDGAKVASYACANSAFDPDALDRLLHATGAGPKPGDGNPTAAATTPPPPPPSPRPCTIPIVNIPTSLSGGEYTPFGGATDFRTRTKRSFRHPSMGARLVILDPRITISTPPPVWLSSGMRAVDHCVEGLCSVYFRPAAATGEVKERDQQRDAEVEEAERHFAEGLRLLLPNLLITARDREDLGARTACMRGVVEAMRGVRAGVPMGASHGIGHQLGPMGVGHGETSCVLLPSVLRYNARHGEGWVRERQALVLSICREQDGVVQILSESGHDTCRSDLGDFIAAYVKTLALPGNLTDVGIGTERYKELAINSMTDRYIPTNPVTITQLDQVEGILHMATNISMITAEETHSTA